MKPRLASIVPIENASPLLHSHLLLSGLLLYAGRGYAQSSTQGYRLDIGQSTSTLAASPDPVPRGFFVFTANRHMSTSTTVTRRFRKRPSKPDTVRTLPGLLHSIGNTALIEIRNSETLSPGVRVFAKAEHLNPGGSVKDRPALRMVMGGLASGALAEGRTLIDATSGNTGIAYAMIGSALRFPVTLAVPSNASSERKDLLRTYGANLILTDALEGTDGAQRVVREIVGQAPGRYFYPDQYSNDENWRAHFEGTGHEILQQTSGAVTHFVAALGTTGTFTGVTRRLKGENPNIRCIAVQPDSPLHGMEGVKHLESAEAPGIFDPRLPDDYVTVSTDEAIDAARRLARNEGVFVGVSAGANVVAALRVAEQLDRGVVVTILCDTGTRYLSEALACSDRHQ